ncbi:HK97 family prohead protease [Lactococcus phage CHPC129]|uniref:Capsid and scaffold protein n=1 Tax=Lactococcus phage CHPC129 TaxID=2675246 RepID=A0A650ETE3_9CAUD|nr:HK97 family prohead protease [Lactococcus phage CHPC129]QGT52771.1 capsid and scaffold protein [Lactococcus phage CHPC129]
MKLITNSAEIKVTENEDGSKSLQGIGSDVGVKNLNDITLTPNCIDFDRERYPLLYEHGAGSSEVIGDAKVYYDLASNKYLTDFILYDNAPNITKAVENGAFNALSMAYYITDYEFAQDASLIVNKAQFKEISLVSVPADPNARFIQNALGEELTEERNKIIESRNALKEIEDIKKKYE